MSDQQEEQWNKVELLNTLAVTARDEIADIRSDELNELFTRICMAAKHQSMIYEGEIEHEVLWNEDIDLNDYESLKGLYGCFSHELQLNRLSLMEPLHHLLMLLYKKKQEAEER